MTEIIHSKVLQDELKEMRVNYPPNIIINIRHSPYSTGMLLIQPFTWEAMIK